MAYSTHAIVPFISLIKSLFMKLLDWESEIGVRERLIPQCEMPPLRIEGLETVTEHGLTQNHTVPELFSGNAATRRRLAVVAGVLTRVGIAAEIGN